MSKLNGPDGQYSISLSLSDLAKACHLRSDDVASTVSQLGFLRHRRKLPTLKPVPLFAEEAEGEEDQKDVEGDRDEWSNTEIIISREGIEREWEKWKVRPMGVLDEACVLL